MDIGLIKKWCLSLSLLALVGCGGGQSAPPNQVALAQQEALAQLAAQLKIIELKFATTKPTPTDAQLTAVFDVNALNDGDNRAAWVAVMSSPSGFPVASRFSAPQAVSPPDVGAVPNDATHVWFSTSNNGISYIWLAVRSPAGQWLIAGNQRQVGLKFVAFATQYIPNVAPAVPQTVKYSVGARLGLILNSLTFNADLLARGVKFATVAGPGTMGVNGLPGTLSVFDVQPVVPLPPAPAPLPGVQPVVLCAPANGLVAAISSNCLETTQMTGGNYQFVIAGVSPLTGVAFQYIYNQVMPAMPAMNAASFPVINSVAPAAKTAWLPNTTVTVNWTLRAGQQYDTVSITAKSAAVIVFNAVAAPYLGLPITTHNTPVPILPPVVVVGAPVLAAPVVDYAEVTVKTRDVNGFVMTTTQGF